MVDKPTRAADTVVQLIVLVDLDRLVIQPCLQQGVAPKRAHVDGIDRLRAVSAVEPGWPSERTGHSSGDRGAPELLAQIARWAADHVRPRRLQCCDTLGDVIALDNRMRVDADDHVPMGSSYR